MAMVVLVGCIQRRVVVRNDMLLRRRIVLVLVRGFHSGVAVLWRRHFGRMAQLKGRRKAHPRRVVSLGIVMEINPTELDCEQDLLSVNFWSHAFLA